MTTMTHDNEEPSAASAGYASVEETETKMAYETVPLQQLLREIADRTASEQDADAIRLAADTLDALPEQPRLALTDDERTTIVFIAHNDPRDGFVRRTWLTFKVALCGLLERTRRDA